MTDAPQATTLSPEVQSLARAFKLDNNRVLLPDDVMGTWRQTMRATPAAKRKDRAAELVALASRFHREAGAAASTAVQQLCDLAAELMQDAAKASDMFSQAGLGQAKKLLGTQAPSTAPRADAKVPEGTIKAGRLGNFPRRS